MKLDFETFEDFWPYYVHEHQDPTNRALHYVGTSLAIGTVAAAALTLNPAWLVVTPVVGYGFAWAGHFIVEKNRPATFQYPLFSLIADFKMYGFMLTDLVLMRENQRRLLRNSCTMDR